jgi:hypothetical protein
MFLVRINDHTFDLVLRGQRTFTSPPEQTQIFVQLFMDELSFILTEPKARTLLICKVRSIININHDKSKVFITVLSETIKSPGPQLAPNANLYNQKQA